MKRFVFALEKVLELRKFHEQEAKVELGRAISVLTKIENNIKRNAVLRSQATSERFLGIHTNENNDIPDGTVSMLAWDNYILRLEQEAQRLEEEAAAARVVVEEKRNLYLEASRELKVMEKLKEKRQEEYKEEALAAETLERDDAWRRKA
jgi:flagellar FliJ protein